MSLFNILNGETEFLEEGSSMCLICGAGPSSVILFEVGLFNRGFKPCIY